MFVGNGPGKVLHHRPTGVGAELVAAGIVELLDRTHQRHVPVADQLEEVLRRHDVPLGDRNHQPQVGPDDLVLRRDGLVVEPFDLVHQVATRPGRIQLGAKPGGLVLQVVHPAEQMGLLVPSQQRHLVQAGQIRRQSTGEPRFFRRRVRLGNRAKHPILRFLRTHPDESAVGHVIERQLHDPPGTHFGDDPVDAGPGAAKSLREQLDRFAVPVLLINLPFRFLLQRPVAIGKDRRVGMLVVELFQRVADGLRAAAGLLGEPFGHVGGATTGVGQSPSPLDDRRAILVRQLAETRAATHPLLVPFDKPIDGTLQKPHALPAVEHEPPADQSLTPPAGNGLRRYVESLGQLLDRQHPLTSRLGCHPGRLRHVLDKQPQIVCRLPPAQPEIGVRFGPIIGDSEAYILVRVRARRFQLA